MKKTGNKTRLRKSTYSERIRISGESQMTEDKMANEIAHNTVDNGGSILSMVIKHDSIFYGNNSNYCPFDVYDERVVHSPPIGHINNSTSYYGSGGTTIHSNIDGSTNYTVHRDAVSDKKVIRMWEHNNKCKDTEYTEDTGNNILFSGGADIVEYELTHEEYLKYSMSSWLGIEPTYMVMLRRFTDSHRKYSAATIVNSINTTLILKNYLLTSKVRVDTKKRRGSWVKSRQLFFPYVKPLGNSFEPVKTLPDLPRFKSNPTIEYEGATFEMYIIKKLDAGSGVEYRGLQDGTDQLRDIINTKEFGRGSNGVHLVFDMNNTLLSGYDSQLVSGGDIYPRGYNKDVMSNNIVCIKHIGGKYKFPTVKSGPPKNKFKESMVRAHIEELDIPSNSHLKHTNKKIENAIVKDRISRLTSGNPVLQSGLIRSLLKLTENKVGEDILLNPDCHEAPGKYHKDRECDWLISKQPKIEEYIAHLEFADGTEDWVHIDTLVARLNGELADNHVYVVADFNTSKKYRQRLEEYCNNSKSKSTVWMVQIDDFTDGQVENFKRIK